MPVSILENSFILDENPRRDTNVLGNQIYLTHGQGCDTVWFRTVPEARKICEKLGRVPNGHDAGLCHLCKCHYSHGTPEHTTAPFEYACSNWKKLIGQGRIAAAEKDRKEILEKHGGPV